MSTYQGNESPLFLMRLWGEDDISATDEVITAQVGTDGAIRSKWRGKLLHVATGEAQYFCGWPELLVLLQSMFPEDSTFRPPDSGSTD